MKFYHLLPAVIITALFTKCNSPAKIQIAQQTPAVSIDSVSISIPEDAIVVEPLPYRASETIATRLVHTKLDLRFDWNKETAIGKAWITLKPHFYATDSLTLDAKAFDLRAVELVSAKGHVPLKYQYDSVEIKIKLDKVYKKDEAYTIYIDYTAQPNKVNSVPSLVAVKTGGCTL